ncbi:MAG: DUF998 domain-containing protein [Aeromicrobium sp.]
MQQRTVTTHRHRLGALMWIVRPAYFAAEIAVAAWSTARYSFVDNTISDLGAVECTSIQRFGDAVPVCSPAHDLLNASFVVYGALMALGAVLLHGRFGRGWLAMALTALLVVSGVSSIATGLTPLDLYRDGHVLAAGPLFVAQPIALVVLGLLVRARRPRTGSALIATGALCGVAAGVFIGVDHAVGVTERMALWPVFVALAVVGVQELRSAATDT